MNKQDTELTLGLEELTEDELAQRAGGAPSVVILRPAPIGGPVLRPTPVPNPRPLPGRPLPPISGTGSTVMCPW